MTAGDSFKILFYVQHLLGLGHLMRASRIAVALQASGFQVTLVTGGVMASDFHVPGVEHVPLPPIAVRGSDFSTLVDAEDEPIDDNFKDQRCQKLLDIYAAVEPAIVILEAFPFGRRQMRFELLPLIDRINATTPRPLLVNSVRDVVQRRTKPGRDAQTAALINSHFDHVLVHGDPLASELSDSFSQAGRIADKIIYTGLVFGFESKGDQQPFDIVVSAGGGAVGFNLICAALEAARLLSTALSWVVITGPNLPEDQIAELQTKCPAHVQLERFRDDFTGMLQATSLSISQAGYNTVNDLMQAGCRAILVPYSAHGETEQTDRAMRLSSLGIVTVIKEEDLSGPLLASVIPRVLSTDPPAASASQKNGADRTAAILRELVCQHLSAAAG